MQAVRAFLIAGALLGITGAATLTYAQAPGQAPASSQRVGIPGSATLAAGEAVDFFKAGCGGVSSASSPCSAPPQELVVVYAASPASAAIADVSYDGAVLMIAARDGATIAVTPPDAGSCTTLDNTLGTVECHIVASFFRPGPVRFSTFDSSNGTGASGAATYAPGWNLVAGPAGTAIRGGDGPLYTLQAGDTNYEALPSETVVRPGEGYWAYFDSATTITLPGRVTPPLTIPLPAGQYVMIGNPSTAAVQVVGADVVYTYDPTTGQYQQATTLEPGQGAWAYSAAGAAITVGTLTSPP